MAQRSSPLYVEPHGAQSRNDRGCVALRRVGSRWRTLRPDRAMGHADQQLVARRRAAGSRLATAARALRTRIRKPAKRSQKNILAARHAAEEARHGLKGDKARWRARIQLRLSLADLGRRLQASWTPSA